MSLEVETKYFEERKADLLKTYEGQFVVITAEELVGAFTTEAQAYQAGVERLGNVPFLVKRVQKDEPVVSYLALQHGLLDART